MTEQQKRALAALYAAADQLRDLGLDDLAARFEHIANEIAERTDDD